MPRRRTRSAARLIRAAGPALRWLGRSRVPRTAGAGAGADLPRRPGPGGRLRQERQGDRRPGRARLRVRRGRHGHRGTAAGQPAAAPVPAAGRPGDREPDGLQQRRRRGRRAAARPTGGPAGPAGSRDGSSSGSTSARRKVVPEAEAAARLPQEHAAAGAVRRLPRGERLLAEHPGSAGPAGGGEAAAAAGRRSAGGRPGRADARVPLLVKIAPDLSDDDVLAVADLAVATGLDGIVATNTTISRAGLRSPSSEVEAAGAGGLSGAPLRARALEVLTLLRDRVGAELTLIGVGGIDYADRRARAPGGRGGPAAGLHRLHLRGPGVAAPRAAGARRRARRGVTVVETFGARLRRAMDTLGPVCAGIDPHASLLAAWGLGRRPARAGEVRHDGGRGVRGPGGGGQAAVGVLRAARVARGRGAGAGAARLPRGGHARGARRQARRHRLDRAGVRRRLSRPRPRRCARTRSPPAPSWASARCCRCWRPPSATAAGVFVLALTSNPEGAQVQGARAGTGRTVAGEVLAALAERNAGAEPLGSYGAVVGATLGATERGPRDQRPACSRRGSAPKAARPTAPGRPSARSGTTSWWPARGTSWRPGRTWTRSGRPPRAHRRAGDRASAALSDPGPGANRRERSESADPALRRRSESG